MEEVTCWPPVPVGDTDPNDATGTMGFFSLNNNQDPDWDT